MSYSCKWYLPGQIFYLRFWGESSVEELREALLEQQRQFEACDRSLIHVISDSSAVTKPLSTNEALSVTRALGPTPRLAWTVVVGEKSAVVRLTMSITRHVLNLRVRYCDTIPEAIAFLKDINENLDWSLADESVLAGG